MFQNYNLEFQFVRYFLRYNPFNMEKDIKAFKSFYRNLKLHVTNCERLLTEAEKPLIGVSNQMFKIGIVQSADPEDEIHVKFPDLKEKLLGQLYMMLEENLKSLRAIDNEINSGNLELKMLLSQLEMLNRPIVHIQQESGEEISNWNCLYPSFDDLIEMAIDAWRYYQNLWLNIHCGILCFDQTDDESYSNLKKSFVEDEKRKNRIKWILALTSLLIED